ncbi:MAG: amidohydrolase family protein [Candidatus Velthaea sp.]
MQTSVSLAIRCGLLYDGTGAAPQRNVTLVLERGQIERIVANDEPLIAARTLEAAAVTPGLINSHVHLEFSGDPDQTVFILKTPIQKTLTAAENARKSLYAGVTTVRDLGGAESNAIELRDAIAKGEHDGPRIIPAGRALCMTGGHGSFIGRETDGPWDARKAVREQRKAGADCIKLIATGGVLTKGAVPGLDQLTEEEMRAAILEAATHGMRVAAHAIGTSGIKNALRAGVDSIEHGHLLDDEAIALFKEHGAYLVPTIAAVTCIFEHASDGKQPDFVVRKATELYEAMRRNIGKAYKAGVMIAGGSDAGTPYNYHANYAYEVELMQTVLGMGANEALRAATKVAGELLATDAGVLAAGRPADLLLLDGNLETDTLALRAPRVVIKGGAVAIAR